MTRYFGKICTQHPEMKGERMKSNFACIGCKRERWQDWAKRNKDKTRVTREKYRDKNPDKIEIIRSRSRRKCVQNTRYHTYRRRLAKLCRIPQWADMPKIRAIYREAKLSGMTVDHIIPLRGKLVSGLHVHNNLQLLTASENFSKSNKFKVE